MKEKVFFKKNNGIELCGILSCLDKKVNSIVIMCHGFGSNKDSGTYVGLEKILNERGISTFRFDFYGHGESEGKFENITISKAVDDVLTAISFLKEKGYKKIGLFGGSFGGMAVTLAASKEDVFVLALKCPVSDLLEHIKNEPERYPIKKWKEKGYIYRKDYLTGEKQQLNYSFFEDSKKINSYDIGKKVKAPTIIVHGDKDNVVPLEQSIKLSKIIPNCKLKIIKGADHFMKEPAHRKKMLDLISEFISNNI